MVDTVQTLEDRLRLLIAAVTSTDRKWKDMERATGVPAASWVDFNREKKRATAEMVEAVSRAWPQFSFWLSTGIVDPAYGHISPLAGKELPSATRYFMAALAEKRVRERLAGQWIKDELGEGFSLKGLGDGADLILRNIENLQPGIAPEVREARQETLQAERLREVEIMALNTLPTLDYGQTEAFLALLKGLLEGIADTPLGKDSKLTLSRIKKIMAAAATGVEQNKAWVAAVEEFRKQPTGG